MMTVEQLRAQMELVNDYWMAQNPDVGDCAWERAAYFRGCMAAYEVLGKPAYLQYAADWANANHWNFHRNEHFDTTNADDLSCGEVYMDLMLNCGIPGTWEPMKRTMAYHAEDPKNDYWWWVDTMYMALNFYHRIGFWLQDARLPEKAWRLFCNTRTERRLYDEEEHLWLRDEDFLPEKALSPSGKKIFWSRGNGWVFAGLARTLSNLPVDYVHAPAYRAVFTDMAGALCRCQCADGFWRSNLLEPELFPMPETSGTALITLGLLTGYRLGLLQEDAYRCALRGFEALNREAVEPSGRIGWVQGVALKPGPTEKSGTNDYAVGTYLLICRELIMLAKEKGHETL